MQLGDGVTDPMTQPQLTRAELADLVIHFTEAFNRDDLDGVMSFMAEDAIYDEFNGKINQGVPMR